MDQSNRVRSRKAACASCAAHMKKQFCPCLVVTSRPVQLATDLCHHALSVEHALKVVIEPSFNYTIQVRTCGHVPGCERHSRCVNRARDVVRLSCSARGA